MKRKRPQPGREMDMEIAEQVFGHKIELTLDGPAIRKGKRLVLLPHYSESFPAGWQVGSWIAKRTGEFYCGRRMGVYVCEFGNDPATGRELRVVGRTSAHATCLAALSLVKMDEAQATD